MQEQLFESATLRTSQVLGDDLSFQPLLCVAGDTYLSLNTEVSLKPSKACVEPYSPCPHPYTLSRMGHVFILMPNQTVSSLGLGGKKTEGKENLSLSPTMRAKRGDLNGYSPGGMAVSDELLPEGVRACQRTRTASGQASEMTLPCVLPLKS